MAFERFTKDARRVVVRSQDEARHLGARAIHPEHLLLGVASADPGDPAARALADAGLDAGALRQGIDDDLAEGLAAIGIPAEVVEAVGHPPPSRDSLRFAPAAKQALAQALRAALERHDGEIRTVHVLLGVLRTPSDTVDRLLARAGTDRDALRAVV